MESMMTLSMENLSALDERRCAEEFNRELRRVIEDVRERPLDPTMRVVTLKIKIQPPKSVGTDATGRVVLDEARLAWEVNSSLPKLQKKDLHVDITSANEARFYGHGKGRTPLERAVDEMQAAGRGPDVEDVDGEQPPTRQAKVQEL